MVDDGRWMVDDGRWTEDRGDDGWWTVDGRRTVDSKNMDSIYERRTVDGRRWTADSELRTSPGAVLLRLSSSPALLVGKPQRTRSSLARQRYRSRRQLPPTMARGRREPG